MGARNRDVHLPQPAARLHRLVSRPHAGYDAAERLCRARGVLHHSRVGRRGADRCAYGSASLTTRPSADRGDESVRPESPRDPIAIQDRSFNTDGSLFYPDTREFFDDYDGPYIPTTDVSPIWNPEFFGNCIVVNGRTWPYLEVAPGRYRLRLLNGCQSRFLILKFDDPRVDVWQIGSEGGYLRAPVQLKEILMSPAERADIIGGLRRGQVRQERDVAQCSAGRPLRRRGLSSCRSAHDGAGDAIPREPERPGELRRSDDPACATGDADHPRARRSGHHAPARVTRDGGAFGRTGESRSRRGSERSIRTQAPRLASPPSSGKIPSRRTRLRALRKRGSFTTSLPMRTRSTFTRCSSR